MQPDAGFPRKTRQLCVQDLRASSVWATGSPEGTRFSDASGRTLSAGPTGNGPGAWGRATIRKGTRAGSTRTARGLAVSRRASLRPGGFAFETKWVTWESPKGATPFTPPQTPRVPLAAGCALLHAPPANRAGTARNSAPSPSGTHSPAPQTARGGVGPAWEAATAPRPAPGSRQTDHLSADPPGVRVARDLGAETPRRRRSLLRSLLRAPRAALPAARFAAAAPRRRPALPGGAPAPGAPRSLGYPTALSNGSAPPAGARRWFGPARCPRWQVGWWWGCAPAPGWRPRPEVEGLGGPAFKPLRRSPDLTASLVPPEQLELHSLTT